VAQDRNLGSRVLLSLGPNRGEDTYGHGGFVIDVAAGHSQDKRYIGIAPGSDIVSIGLGAHPYTSNLIGALSLLYYLAPKYKIRVVNLSVSETAPSSYLASALDAVVEKLWQSGIVVVTAAGNRGPGEANFAPGNDPFAITVGATDINGTSSSADDSVTSWSSRGDNGTGIAKPELVAPGRLVTGFMEKGLSLWPYAPFQNIVNDTHVRMSGTSFSAPQVAGAAAILLEQHPKWTPDQVKWALVNTARPLLDGSGASTVDLDAATAFSGTPGSANQGIVPSDFQMPNSSALYAGNKWQASSWVASSWDASSWVGSSWVTGGWDASSWVASSWVADTSPWN
jgi:serine protease AprX